MEVWVDADQALARTVLLRQQPLAADLRAAATKLS
jgi:hypothetical protein